jgi:hypothetical protein
MYNFEYVILDIFLSNVWIIRFINAYVYRFRTFVADLFYICKHLGQKAVTNFQVTTLLSFLFILISI